MELFQKACAPSRKSLDDFTVRKKHSHAARMLDLQMCIDLMVLSTEGLVGPTSLIRVCAVRRPVILISYGRWRKPNTAPKASTWFLASRNTTQTEAMTGRCGRISSNLKPLSRQRSQKDLKICNAAARVVTPCLRNAPFITKYAFHACSVACRIFHGRFTCPSLPLAVLNRPH